MANPNRISVDPEEIARFSAIANEWWDANGKFKPLHRLNPVRIAYIRDQIATHYKLNPSSSDVLSDLSIADIGCGGGLVAEPLSRLGASVTGVDAGEKNIRVAELHALQSGLTIDYRCTTAEELAAQGKTFDVVTALEIIEHVADVNAFLEALQALVKPGGLLILSTLNRTFKSLAMAKIGAEYILQWLPRGTHQWSKFLRPSEIVLPLQAKGLRHIDTAGLIFNPLRNSWAIHPTDIDVNYLVVLVKDKS